MVRAGGEGRGPGVPRVLALGATQTVAWASSTYLPAILATPIAVDLGLPRASVFGAYSVSLVVMALAGPAVGRAIDLRGGKAILAASNLVLAAGLAALAFASSSWALYASWCAIGLGMALGLYDAAFATLVRLHGADARGPITGITLIAGFASTVGWPLTSYLSGAFGWRASCLAWAALHILIALPLNLLAIPRAESPGKTPSGARIDAERAAGSTGAKAGDEAKAGDPADLPVSPEPFEPGGPRAGRRDFALMAIFFAATAFVTSAMASHLPGLLRLAGASAVAALTAASLLGPAQVAARLAEFLAARRFRYHPLVTARVAAALHPIGCLALAAFGGPAMGGAASAGVASGGAAMGGAASAFALLHGAGNGMITIAKGTLPLAIFGPRGYGLRLGFLSILARGAQATAPLAFGLVLDARGAGAAMALSASLSAVALGALLALRAGAGE